MFVAFEVVAGIIRVFNSEEEAEAGQPYKAVITVLVDDQTATLKGALGKLTKADMIGIRDVLMLRGITKIRMKRAGQHILPTGGKVSEEDGFAVWEAAL